MAHAMMMHEVKEQTIKRENKREKETGFDSHAILNCRQISFILMR